MSGLAIGFIVAAATLLVVPGATVAYLERKPGLALGLLLLAVAVLLLAAIGEC